VFTHASQIHGVPEPASDACSKQMPNLPDRWEWFLSIVQLGILLA